MCVCVGGVPCTGHTMLLRVLASLPCAVSQDSIRCSCVDGCNFDSCCCCILRCAADMPCCAVLLLCAAMGGDVDLKVNYPCRTEVQGPGSVSFQLDNSPGQVRLRAKGCRVACCVPLQLCTVGLGLAQVSAHALYCCAWVYCYVHTNDDCQSSLCAGLA